MELMKLQAYTKDVGYRPIACLIQTRHTVLFLQPIAPQRNGLFACVHRHEPCDGLRLTSVNKHTYG